MVVNTENGTLKLKVKMNALKDKTAQVVDDLKQLSGEHGVPHVGCGVLGCVIVITTCHDMPCQKCHRFHTSSCYRYSELEHSTGCLWHVASECLDIGPAAQYYVVSMTGPTVGDACSSSLFGG